MYVLYLYLPIFRPIPIYRADIHTDIKMYADMGLMSYANDTDIGWKIK